MKNSENRHTAPNLFMKYRSEIVSVTIAIAMNTITILDFFYNFAPEGAILIAICLTILILLVVVIVNMKRYFKENMKDLEEAIKIQKQENKNAAETLFNLIGIPQEENPFHIREQHYTKEKYRLGKICVLELLPEILNRVSKEHPGFNKSINLFLDAGTTITPIFRSLISIRKDELDSKKINLYNGVKIYTNNLAGLDLVQKQKTDEQSLFSDADFHSTGGQLLRPFKALTGDETIDFVTKFKKSGNYINISVVTSNWFLTEAENNNISKLKICAKGRGHLDFKEALIDISHYLIIITPLGKILSISEANELENLVPKQDHYNKSDKYRSFLLPDKKRNNTYLLTTYRSVDSLSPLKQLSIRIKRTQQTNYSKNFQIWAGNTEFNPYEPYRDDKLEAESIDVPHDYIRNNFLEAYGYPKP